MLERHHDQIEETYQQPEFIADNMCQKSFRCRSAYRLVDTEVIGGRDTWLMLVGISDAVEPLNMPIMVMKSKVFTDAPRL
jgi:hypothetical protein